MEYSCMSTDEAAALLEVSRARVLEILRSQPERLPGAKKMGRDWRIPRQAVEEFKSLDGGRPAKRPFFQAVRQILSGGPKPNQRIVEIRDNRGRVHEFEEFGDGIDPVFRITYNGRPSGHLYFLEYPSTESTLVADLVIEKSFRRSGLGTALLNRAISTTRDRGFRWLYARITEKDLMSFPGLVSWYTKHGFEACDISEADHQTNSLVPCIAALRFKV